MAERTAELRRDIEQTRERMTGTVDAIEDRVSPGRMVERRVNRMKEGATRIQHKVMGAPRQAASRAGSGASAAGSTVGDAASSVTGAAGDAASTVRDQVAQTPQRITEGTQGNPLAAGAVAFGLGVLLGSLAPPTKEEEQIAETLVPAIQDEAKALGQQVADTAKQGAQDAADQLKDAGQQAVEQVKDQAQGATEEVAGRADQARTEVQDQAAQAADDVKDQAQQAKDQVTGS